MKGKVDMELKEGMYVRTSNGISQILSTGELEGFDSLSLIDSGSIIRGFFIKKASFKIIDLIEVGDYVNGHIVVEARKDRNYIDLTYDDEWFYLHNEDIETVLTHEQYKWNMYEVK